MYCVHIYIINRKISVTFDLEKQYSRNPRTEKDMRKHLYYLIASMLIITISLNARTNYNYKKLQRENLGRGVVAIRKDASTVTISWRYLSSDPMDTEFNVYRNGEKSPRNRSVPAPYIMTRTQAGMLQLMKYALL